jgi:hypothetical protein
MCSVQLALTSMTNGICIYSSVCSLSCKPLGLWGETSSVTHDFDLVIYEILCLAKSCSCHVCVAHNGSPSIAFHMNKILLQEV